MIPRIAKFEKVSFPQFAGTLGFFGYTADLLLPDSHYERIPLPTRATSGSAGYDFHSTMDFVLNPGESITIPSGIRCSIAPGWALFMLPKSGLGFKFRLQLDNTVGLVDAKRYFS